MKPNHNAFVRRCNDSRPHRQHPAPPGGKITAAAFERGLRLLRPRGEIEDDAAATGVILESMTASNAHAVYQAFRDIMARTGRRHDAEWGLMLNNLRQALWVSPLVAATAPTIAQITVGFAPLRAGVAVALHEREREDVVDADLE